MYGTKMTRNDEQDLIKITHYINPHMFWYKYEDTLLSNVELTEWESKLNESFSNRHSTTAIHSAAKLNEIVAVFNFSLNRWIRAKCIEIVQFMIANTKYVMWAIDYGIPFQTEAKWINKIPSTIGAQPEQTVFFGGIANIVPAEKEFNFETYTSEIKASLTWSTLAVRTIENLINEAAHIRFIRQLISKEGQFFGNLEFLTYTNQIIKADSSLVDINHAIRTNEFLRIIRQIKTNQIPLWKTNDGASFVSRYNLNKISVTERPGGIEGHQIDEEVSRKVSDWAKRNIQSQYDDRRSVIDDHASICETTVSMKISRQIATRGLMVENDECETKDKPPKLKFGNDLENHQEKHENYLDNHQEKRKSSRSPSDELNANENDLSIGVILANSVTNQNSIPVSQLFPNNHTKGVQNVDTTSNAMKLLTHRFNLKRRLLQSIKAQRMPPPNIIPAGFDLRNLRSKVSL